MISHKPSVKSFGYFYLYPNTIGLVQKEQPQRKLGFVWKAPKVQFTDSFDAKRPNTTASKHLSGLSVSFFLEYNNISQDLSCKEQGSCSIFYMLYVLAIVFMRIWAERA